jgi:hypothetical protein
MVDRELYEPVVRVVAAVAGGEDSGAPAPSRQPTLWL